MDEGVLSIMVEDGIWDDVVKIDGKYQITYKNGVELVDEDEIVDRIATYIFFTERRADF